VLLEHPEDLEMLECLGHLEQIPLVLVLIEHPDDLTFLENLSDQKYLEQNQLDLELTGHLDDPKKP